MPNHVDHDCWVVGPAEDVQDLINTCLKEDGSLNADFLIPYPLEYKEQDAVAHAWDELANASKAAGLPVDWSTRPKDGYNAGGYDWCCNMWGTKWGTYDGNGVQDCEYKRKGWRKIQLNWFTAWSPAHPVYSALAKRYPRCTIRIKYYESGMAYKGSLKFVNGELLEETSGNYNGSRGG